MIHGFPTLIAWFWCFFLFTIKLCHEENTQLRERMQIPLLMLFFCLALNGNVIIRNREIVRRHITNGAKLLLLHQIHPNHLINAGAWKHQHMVALNLHHRLCDVNLSVFSPVFAGYVRCRCCCIASHYLSNQSAKWKCWEAEEKTGNESGQYEPKCYLR